MRAGMSLQKRSLVCQLEGGVGSESGSTVDGTNPATVEVGSLSHYLEGFAHPRWRRISSINSTTQNLDLQTVVHWKYLLAFTDSEQNRTGPECNFAELGKWKQHGVFYLSVKVCIFYLPTIKLHIYTNTPLSMYGLKQLEFWCTLKQMDVRCVCLKSHKELKTRPWQQFAWIVFWFLSVQVWFCSSPVFVNCSCLVSNGRTNLTCLYSQLGFQGTQRGFQTKVCRVQSKIITFLRMPPLLTRRLLPVLESIFDTL